MVEPKKGIDWDESFDDEERWDEDDFDDEEWEDLEETDW